jgi:hypothetical protein
LSRADLDGHSDLVYNNATHTITLYDRDHNVIGEWRANNNVTQSRTIGRLQDRTYDFQDTSTPHTHGNRVGAHGTRMDSAQGEYGEHGILRVEPFIGADGRRHEGVGVHSGREDTPDRAGRSGPDAATDGCIRTTEQGMSEITSFVHNDPLQTLTVQNNRPTQPARQPPNPQRRREEEHQNEQQPNN